MNEVQQIREKYNNKDIIEIDESTLNKVIEWMTVDKKDVRESVKKLINKNGGFVKFLNSGVVLVKSKWWPRYYPFEFKDNVLYQSLYFNDPKDSTLKLVCKIKVAEDTKYEVIEGTYDAELAYRNSVNEIDRFNKGEESMIKPILETILLHKKDLKEEEIVESVCQEYLSHCIKTQFIFVLGVNAYLALLKKEILISKIEQQRVFKASTKPKKKPTVNTAYRYLVSLPPGYVPRKFDVNYLLSQWERSGHSAKRWVRQENAEKLSKRANGIVTKEVRGNYIAIKIPIKPQTCHRKVVQMTKENKGTKTYNI